QRAKAKRLWKSLRERKEAEAALVESKEKLLLANYRFRVAEEASRSFNYDWNLQSDTVVRSDNFSQVLGYGAHEIAETWEAWKALTHPDDFRFSKQEAIEYLNNLEGDLLEAEYRVRRPGIVGWEHHKAASCGLGAVDGRDVGKEISRRTANRLRT